MCDLGFCLPEVGMQKIGSSIVRPKTACLLRASGITEPTFYCQGIFRQARVHFPNSPAGFEQGGWPLKRTRPLSKTGTPSIPQRFAQGGEGALCRRLCRIPGFSGIGIDRADEIGVIYRRHPGLTNGRRLHGDQPGGGVFLYARFIRIAATGFGSGYAPTAPGTAGTLVGLGLYWVYAPLPWPIWLLTVIALTCLAWLVSDEAERLFGRKDAPQIVIDEIAGIQWGLFLVAPTVTHMALGFALFRLFDIGKPFPARRFQDRLPGGLGVVADDLAAGLYTNLVLQILVRGFGL
jgi:phosphatidylglycerophosphatase A